MGIVDFATYAPQMLFSMYGGVLADRFDRRRLLVLTHIGEAAGAALIGVLVATGTASIANVALATLGLVTTFPLALAVISLVGLFHVSNMALALNTVQHEVPEALRGRVMAVHMTGLVGLIPLTSLVGAAIADRIGIGATFTAAGLTCLAFSLVLLPLRRRDLRLREAPPEPETVAALGTLVEEEA